MTHNGPAVEVVSVTRRSIQPMSWYQPAGWPRIFPRCKVHLRQGFGVQRRGSLPRRSEADAWAWFLPSWYNVFRSQARSRYKDGKGQKTYHGTVILLTATCAVSRHNVESKPENCPDLPQLKLEPVAGVRVHKPLRICHWFSIGKNHDELITPTVRVIFRPSLKFQLKIWNKI